MSLPLQSLVQMGVIVLAWFAALLLRQVPVGGEWLPAAPSTYLVLASWMLALALTWILTASIWPTSSRPAAISPLVEGRVIGLAALAATGALFLIVEFAVIRGYGFSMAVAEIRQLEVQAVETGRGGSILSGAGRLLMPALIVAWILFRQSDRASRPRVRVILYCATALVLWAQASFEGGRFFLAALVLAALFSAPSAPGRRRPDRAYRSALVLVAAVLVMGLVFVQRPLSVQVDLRAAYSTFASSFSLDVDADVLERLDGPLAALWFIAMMFWVYVTHSINELHTLLAHPQMTHALGGYQFPQLLQAARMLFGVQPEFDLYALPNPGTYLTAYGGWYVDFGHIGAAIGALLLGVLTGAATTERNRGRRGALATAAPILLTIVLFAPIHSLLTTLWPALVWCWASCTCLEFLAKGGRASTSSTREMFS